MPVHCLLSLQCMYNFVQSSETVLESKIHFTKYTLQNTLYKIHFIWLILARCWGDPKPQSIPATHWYDIIIIIIVIFFSHYHRHHRHLRHHCHLRHHHHLQHRHRYLRHLSHDPCHQHHHHPHRKEDRFFCWHLPYLVNNIIQCNHSLSLWTNQ